MTEWELRQMPEAGSSLAVSSASGGAWVTFLIRQLPKAAAALFGVGSGLILARLFPILYKRLTLYHINSLCVESAMLALEHGRAGGSSDRRR